MAGIPAQQAFELLLSKRGVATQIRDRYRAEMSRIVTFCSGKFEIVEVYPKNSRTNIVNRTTLFETMESLVAIVDGRCKIYMTEGQLDGYEKIKKNRDVVLTRSSESFRDSLLYDLSTVMQVGAYRDRIIELRNKSKHTLLIWDTAVIPGEQIYRAFTDVSDTEDSWNGVGDQCQIVYSPGLKSFIEYFPLGYDPEPWVVELSRSDIVLAHELSHAFRALSGGDVVRLRAANGKWKVAVAGDKYPKNEADLNSDISAQIATAVDYELQDEEGNGKLKRVEISEYLAMGPPDGTTFFLKHPVPNSSSDPEVEESIIDAMNSKVGSTTENYYRMLRKAVTEPCQVLDQRVQVGESPVLTIPNGDRSLHLRTSYRETIPT